MGQEAAGNQLQGLEVEGCWCLVFRWQDLPNAIPDLRSGASEATCPVFSCGVSPVPHQSGSAHARVPRCLIAVGLCMCSRPCGELKRARVQMCTSGQPSLVSAGFSA